MFCGSLPEHREHVNTTELSGFVAHVDESSSYNLNEHCVLTSFLTFRWEFSSTFAVLHLVAAVLEINEGINKILFQQRVNNCSTRRVLWRRGDGASITQIIRSLPLVCVSHSCNGYLCSVVCRATMATNPTWALQSRIWFHAATQLWRKEEPRTLASDAAETKLGNMQTRRKEVGRLYVMLYIVGRTRSRAVPISSFLNKHS